MSLLHIEPENLRATSRRLSQMAEEIDWQIQRLENTKRILQTAWQGSSRLQFEAEIDRRLHTLRRLSHEVSELSVRLQREAVKWEEIGYTLR